MKNSINQEQKGAIDLIFIVVLVILLAAGAFAVWRIQAADETVSETATNTSNQQTTPLQDKENGGTDEEAPAPLEHREETFSVMLPAGWQKTTDMVSEGADGSEIYRFQNDLAYLELWLNPQGRGLNTDISLRYTVTEDNRGVELANRKRSICNPDQVAFCSAGDSKLQVFIKQHEDNQQSLAGGQEFVVFGVIEGTEDPADSRVDEIIEIVESLRIN